MCVACPCSRHSDFYEDVRRRQVPKHDILVTNPPYSQQHKEQLFRYILETQRPAAEPVPFLVLLPAWSASKLAWRQFLWCLAKLRAGEHSVSFEEAARGERGVRVGAFSDKLEEQVVLRSRSVAVAAAGGRGRGSEIRGKCHLQCRSPSRPALPALPPRPDRQHRYRHPLLHASLVSDWLLLRCAGGQVQVRCGGEGT